MNAVLKTSQLTKTYSSKQVVKELSMTIQQGDYLRLYREKWRRKNNFDPYDRRTCHSIFRFH